MRSKEFLTEMTIPASGDCFQAAGRAEIAGNDDMYLVHAMVRGQGPLAGRRFPHAWIEIGDVVIDYSNGRKIVMRKEQYYKLGQVNPEEPGAYKKYDHESALKRMLQMKHWGPWDLDDERLNESEQLNELANRPYEYVQTMNSPFRSRYRFNTEGDVGYTVQIDTDRDLFSGEPYVSIHFALENLATGKRSIAVTGTGNALRVLTTVRNIALEQIKKVDPTFIRFTAGAPTPSRVKLYDMIATQAPKWFPGYVFNRRTSSGDDIFYQLKKKNVEVKEEQELDELTIDNHKGWGQTPNNANVDYMGIRVMMKPSVFLKLAANLDTNRETARKNIEDMKAHAKSGGTFGAPTLYVEVPSGWRQEKFTNKYPEVTGHEGRHRMNAQLELEGDIPVETHIFLRSQDAEWRNRHMSPAIVGRLNNGIRAEDTYLGGKLGAVILGPLFTK